MALLNYLTIQLNLTSQTVAETNGAGTGFTEDTGSGCKLQVQAWTQRSWKVGYCCSAVWHSVWLCAAAKSASCLEVAVQKKVPASVLAKCTGLCNIESCFPRLEDAETANKGPSKESLFPKKTICLIFERG